jgi:hypothetical protein
MTPAGQGSRRMRAAEEEPSMREPKVIWSRRSTKPDSKHWPPDDGDRRFGKFIWS